MAIAVAATIAFIAPLGAAAQNGNRPNDLRPIALVGVYMGGGSDFPLWGLYVSRTLSPSLHGFGALSRSTDGDDGGWDILGGVGVRDMRVVGFRMIGEAGVRYTRYADRPGERGRAQLTTGIGWETDLTSIRASLMYRAGWGGRRTDELTLGVRFVLGWR